MDKFPIWYWDGPNGPGPKALAPAQWAWPQGPARWAWPQGPAQWAWPQGPAPMGLAPRPGPMGLGVRARPGTLIHPELDKIITKWVAIKDLDASPTRNLTRISVRIFLEGSRPLNLNSCLRFLTRKSEKCTFLSPKNRRRQRPQPINRAWGPKGPKGAQGVPTGAPLAPLGPPPPYPLQGGL